MTTEQKEKLISVFTTLQILTYQIDDLQADAKLAFHKVKYLSNELLKEIEKSHGKNIKTIWDISGGEETMSALIECFDVLSKEIARVNINQIPDLANFVHAFNEGAVRVE